LSRSYWGTGIDKKEIKMWAVLASIRGSISKLTQLIAMMLLDYKILLWVSGRSLFIQGDFPPFENQNNDTFSSYRDGSLPNSGRRRKSNQSSVYQENFTQNISDKISTMFLSINPSNMEERHTSQNPFVERIWMKRSGQSTPIRDSSLSLEKERHHWLARVCTFKDSWSDWASTTGIRRNLH